MVLMIMMMSMALEERNENENGFFYPSDEKEEKKVCSSE